MWVHPPEIEIPDKNKNASRSMRGTFIERGTTLLFPPVAGAGLNRRQIHRLCG